MTTKKITGLTIKNIINSSIQSAANDPKLFKNKFVNHFINSPEFISMYWNSLFSSVVNSSKKNSSKRIIEEIIEKIVFFWIPKTFNEIFMSFKLKLNSTNAVFIICPSYPFFYGENFDVTIKYSEMSIKTLIYIYTLIEIYESQCTRIFSDITHIIGPIPKFNNEHENDLQKSYNVLFQPIFLQNRRQVMYFIDKLSSSINLNPFKILSDEKLTILIHGLGFLLKYIENMDDLLYFEQLVSLIFTRYYTIFNITNVSIINLANIIELVTWYRGYIIHNNVNKYIYEKNDYNEDTGINTQDTFTHLPQLKHEIKHILKSSCNAKGCKTCDIITKM